MSNDEITWHEVTTGGDDQETLHEAELADGNRYVFRADQKAAIVAAGNTADAVHAEAKKALADWSTSRGPESEIGTNLEAGTPTTDHSSEPQT